MGVEYDLIDIENKTFYDLGKGGWFNLTDMEAFQDEAYLANEILVECFYIDDENYWRDTTKKQEIIKYVKEILAPRLFQLFGKTDPSQLTIVADSCDDISICKAKKYKCVGVRYYDLDPTTYKDRLDYNNRHLIDNEINKRWYNVENYKSYYNFDKY